MDSALPAAMSATSAAVGSHVYFPPASGFPPVGSIVTVEVGSVVVKPSLLPEPPPRGTGQSIAEDDHFTFLKHPLG